MAVVVASNRNETSWSRTRIEKSSHNNLLMKTKTKTARLPTSNPNPNLFNLISNNQSNGKISNGGMKSDDAASFMSSRSVKFDVSGYTKADLRELRMQLVSELEKVREFTRRIESRKRGCGFPADGEKGAKRAAVTVASGTVMKMCATVLRKLSSQKAGAWFNTPVDAVGMGLHDYHTVIDRPMDLGTIKAKLDKGGYNSPEEFGFDVRLTFNNAIAYNPASHDVNVVAGQYLALFEKWFTPIMAKFEAEKQLHCQQVVSAPSPSPSPAPAPAPEPVKAKSPVKKPEFKPEFKPEPRPEPKVRREVTPPPPVVAVERRGRRPEGKLPKPKAKDPNKREMSMEEKHKLGAGLQSLPEEKMAQVIQIIRKRNDDLTQDGDEIELDIEAVDKETLWELDRFVTNYKKMVSKIKRQGLIDGLQSNNVGCSDDTNPNQVGMGERMVEMPPKAKKGGGGDAGEEDVDIGDEMPASNFPPLEIDKDDDKHSSGSSSSSGSDDSSSSDSDSGSSSGSDSDVDDAQSRDNESKNIRP